MANFEPKHLLKIKRMLLVVAICALPFGTYATIWANQPIMDFPAAAIRDCVNGRVVVQFRIVDGHPVDMEIVDSEPDGLYTDSFLRWWSEYDKWRKQVGMRWDDDTAEGDMKDISFNFRPCDESE